MNLVDLHCDLLIYLERHPQGTIFDSEARASYPFMKEGGVTHQVLALFTQTEKGSSLSGKKQCDLFEKLPIHHPECFTFFDDQKKVNSKAISIIPAIENLSGFLEEDEPLNLLFSRLDSFHEKNPVLYISLTWNTENRFGGGNMSQCGLKKDGEKILQHLHGKQIAIDLSHTSDYLAGDILNFLERNNLDIIPIASHSNFRKIVPHARNLPDEFVREIIRKKGVIGLNFVRKFIGEDLPSYFFKQIDHALNLGAEDHLCFGADFFCDQDSPNYALNLGSNISSFHPKYANSSCYTHLIKELTEKYSASLVEKWSSKNFFEYGAHALCS